VVGGRGSSLKVLKGRKIRFLNLGGLRYYEGSESELKILLSVTRAKCHLCGGKVKEVGYARIGDSIELVLCRKCLRDYIEYVHGEGGCRC